MQMQLGKWLAIYTIFVVNYNVLSFKHWLCYKQVSEVRNYGHFQPMLLFIYIVDEPRRRFR